MKTIVATLFAVLMFGVFSSSAKAQTSNILVISQNSSTKVVSVISAPDSGVSGTYLSYSSQLSTTITAIENKLFSGLASGTVLIVRVDANKNITVLVAPDPGLSGQFVVVDDKLSSVSGAIKNRLYLGL